MAKTGFQYYSVETDRYQDKKIRMLKKECGCNGLAVYDYILCEIYRVQGCFLEWDDSTAFDVSEYLGLRETQVNEIVNYCCAVGLFDRGLLTNERVLTSAAIQSRFIDWSQKAKRTGVKIPEKLTIIPEKHKKLTEETQKIQEETDKVKKRKVKKSKFSRTGESLLATENAPEPPPVARPPSLGFYPKESDMLMALPEIKTHSAIERIRITSKITVTTEQIQGMWEVFKGLHFTGEKFYKSENDIFSHFSNWIKDQKFDNGTVKGYSKPNGSSGASALAAKLEQSINARGSQSY